MRKLESPHTQSWRQRNSPQARTYSREYQQQKRKDVLAIFKNICCRCGFSDIRALQIDHIHGGGCLEKREITHSRTAYYRKVIESVRAGEGKYQLLCANCNWIKRAEQQETAPLKDKEE